MAVKRSMGPAPKRDMGKVEAAKELFLCYCCGSQKKRSEFYMSTDPFNSVGVVPYCKDCLERIARNYNDKTKKFSDVTKASLISACERADFPYIEILWDSSLQEVNNGTKSNMWAAYVKNVKMNQYKTLRYRDSDHLKDSGTVVTTIDSTVMSQSSEAIEECEKNRKDIIRLIGYDPFIKEAEEDKPLLYAQLIGYLDMSGDNEDTTRILDSIEIVRGYLQLQKLNDMSAKAFANLGTTGQSGEIKNYMDTKKKVADVISQLAEQSCISLKHNKNASKGENTFAGKIKKLKELNLREAELNAFDIDTCKGMQQVADISHASIMKQLHLDENDYTEMISQQRDMLVKLQKQADQKTEEARILLRENLDLKAYIEEKGMDISEFLSSDTILTEE